MVLSRTIDEMWVSISSVLWNVRGTTLLAMLEGGITASDLIRKIMPFWPV